MRANIILEEGASSIWTLINWHPSPEQLEQFRTLHLLLKKWNDQVNLTRLLKDDDYWIGHILDSLWPLKKHLQDPKAQHNCIDVGTGCGFPGLAVAIAMPNARVTLVDSISRKTSVLKDISNELGLISRTTILTERIEVLAQIDSYRAMFDLAMARAVGPPPVVAEYLVPLIKPYGEAMLFRGKWHKEDQDKLDKALVPLKAKIKTIEYFNLPQDKGIRHLIRLESHSKCPANYPRSTGVPTKKPLGA